MAAGTDYDEQLARARRGGAVDRRTRTGISSPPTSRNAADLLRPVYDELGGADGFVSVEVVARPRARHRRHRRSRPPSSVAGRPAQRDDQDPGDRRRPPRDHRDARRGHQRERHADLRASAATREVIDAYLAGLEAPRGERRRPLDGQQRRVVLREPGRHRDRPPAPRRATRCGARPRSRTPSSRTSCSSGRSRARAGTRSRRRARGCSGRCGRRRRRRTRRTPRRSTSTS